jgi:hypothetical protein
MARVPARRASVSGERRWVLVDAKPVELVGNLAGYLARLGCDVEQCSASRLSVSLSFPETVADEVASLREWCDSWSRGGRSAGLVEEPALG